MQTGRLFSALVKFLLLVLSAAVLLQLAKVVLPWAAPFLVALALARLVQAPAAFLIRRLRLPRKAACTLCLLAVAAAAAGLGFLAEQRLWQEVTQLVDALPSLIAALPVSDGRLEGWLYRLTMAAPVQYQQALSQLPQRLMDALSAIPEALSQASLTAAGELASSAPAIALFCLTTLMAAYFTSVSLPALPGLLQRMLPPAWYRSLARIGHISLDVAGGWLRVQGILLCVTFACLSVGLLALQTRLSLLAAALITLVDALPLLGAGVVLVPWSLLCLLSGRLVQGIGLLVLCAVIMLLRSILEPRLMGKNMGLPPLAALAAMYAGFSVAGVWGLLLAPPLLLLLLGLLREGAFRPEPEDDREETRGDIS